MHEAFGRPHPRHLADLVEDAVENGRRRRGNLQQQVNPAAGCVDALDLGDGLQTRQDSGLGAGLDGQQDGSADASLARRLAELDGVPRDDARGLQPFEPRLDGGPRNL